jgi:hypothetical protein
MFTCPSSPVRATIQPQPSRKSGGQPPSGWGSVLPPSRRRTKAELPPSWEARSTAPEQGSSDRLVKKATVRSKM